MRSFLVERYLSSVLLFERKIMIVLNFDVNYG